MGKLEVHDGSNRLESAADKNHLIHSISNDDWQKYGNASRSPDDKHQSPSAQKDGYLTFDDSCYGGTRQNPSLNSDAKNLREDIEQLKGTGRGTSAYDKAVAKLNGDEDHLRKDVFGLKDKSSDYHSFARTMEGYHQELKSIADDLWQMGFKDQASRTTAYYPLNHYEHEFQNRGKGDPGDGQGDGTANGGAHAGGDPPPPRKDPPSSPPGDSPSPPGQTPPTLSGGQTFDNLEQTQGWTKNLNDGEIGGSGNVQAIDLSQGPGGSLDYHSSMGAYGDTLIARGMNFQPGDNTFQLNMNFNRSAATAGNTECAEQDLVITNKDGMQAVGGSQFNFAEKAPSGMTWFQTWDTKSSQWVNAALVPTPTPDQMHNMSMTVRLNGNDTYTYTNLTLDGKTYALQNNTFAMKQSNWSRNEVLLQLQEDANSKGGPVDIQYGNIQLKTGTT